MKRKIVEYPHSAQLYDLYRQGKEACSTYRVKIHQLFDDVDSTKEVDPLYGGNAELFRETFKGIELFYNDWYQSVMDILRRIPRTSLQAKFTADITDDDKKIGKLYAQRHYAGYMGVLLRDCDKLKTQVERLPEIISDYEKFQSEEGKTTTKRTRPDVVYRLEYDEMTGTLRINGITVHKCNIDSKLDIAIITALKASNHKVAVRRNLRADISRTDIPKPLQKLMFKTGKTVSQMNPEIALEDLERHKLDRATIDADLQKLL